MYVMEKLSYILLGEYMNIIIELKNDMASLFMSICQVYETTEALG